MSELSKLTAAGDSTTLPGYTLSPPGLRELGEAEAEFARAYLSDVAASTKPFDAETKKLYADLALEKLAQGKLNYYGAGFQQCCLAARHLPFLLWLTARVESPKLTREQAAALITRENEAAVSRAVLDAMGFDTGPNVKAGEATASHGQQAESSGAASTASSATSENSVSMTSAA